MGIRIFLGINAILWLSYGIFCLFQPGFLAEAAGVAATSTAGTIELRAMYGGVQSAIGVLCGLAALRDGLQRPALVGLAFVTGGLFLGRITGVVAAGEVSSYTAMALGLEISLASLATWFLSKPDPAAV